MPDSDREKLRLAGVPGVDHACVLDRIVSMKARNGGAIWRCAG
jgi:hypothetical protein